MTIKTWNVDELAAAVGAYTGDVWTCNPGGPVAQDVEITAFGEQGGTPMIETRDVMRGGFRRNSTEWNELTHFMHMAVLTCERADRHTYDRV